MTFKFFTNLEDDIKELFTDSEKEVLPFVDAIGHDIVTNGGPILIEAATDAVQAAQNTSGTGAEKFAAAQASIIQTLTTAGVPIVINTINNAIQGAVTLLKSNSTTAAAPIAA